MKKVVITGVGIFVPKHSNAQHLFDTLYQGNSLLNFSSLSEGVNATSTITSRISEDEIAKFEETYPQLTAPTLSKATKIGFLAASEAIKQASLDLKQTHTRSGLFVAVNKNVSRPEYIVKLSQSQQDSLLSDKDKQLIENELETLNVCQTARFLAKELAISATASTHSDACTAGANALVSGYKRIQSGELDVAVCGAAEYGSHAFMQMHFNKLGASYQNTYEQAQAASRPFDKDRSGCILADGAAFLILESEEHMRKRGGKPLACFKGCSRQSEAYRPTSTDPSGSYYIKSMQDALRNADISAHDIDHISAHGTSTVSNDQAEGQAISRLFEHQPLVTSTKSALGHSLGASGAIEAVLNILSLQNQKVLPTLNYSEPRANEAQLNIVTQGQEKKLRYVLSNSFGFGGENSCLIFSKENKHACC